METKQFERGPDLPPPITQVGAIGWLRRNLFSSWLNSLLTVVTAYLIWLMLPPLMWAYGRRRRPIH